MQGLCLVPSHMTLVSPILPGPEPFFLCPVGQTIPGFYLFFFKQYRLFFLTHRSKNDKIILDSECIS